jgi:uncharacterized caspase-like protein
MLHAVIVGIDRYEDARISSLGYAASDAHAVASLLTSGIQAEDLHIRLLCNQEATRSRILDALGNELARSAGEGDICFIYFAGHGSPETDRSLADASAYLIAHDTGFDTIFTNGIDMERDLVKCFERISHASVVLCFLDCCFSGRAGGRTFEGPGYRQAKPSVRGKVPLSLKGISLGKGRAIVTACGPNQVAYEDEVLAHGIFTYHLLDSLQRPRKGEKTVDVALLYAELAHLVHGYTRARQTPVLNGRLEGARMPVCGG